MPIDAFSDDLDSLRELVAQLSTERDAALAECKRVMEQKRSASPFAAAASACPVRPQVRTS
jgi:hypothetical protein